MEITKGDAQQSLQYMYELELARLRSHEKHMAYIYGLRWGALALAGVTICVGATMLFAGLQGSFDWAIQAPHSIGAKLTNASPGIIFATLGMVLGFFTIIQIPVNYHTDTADISAGIVEQSARMTLAEEKKRRKGSGITLGR